MPHVAACSLSANANELLMRNRLQSQPTKQTIGEDFRPVSLDFHLHVYRHACLKAKLAVSIKRPEVLILNR